LLEENEGINVLHLFTSCQDDLKINKKKKRGIAKRSKNVEKSSK
jgi:hypothetical protein